MASTATYSISNTTNAIILPFTAGGTIRRGCAVKLHSAVGQVVAATAITSVVVGVALNGGASGDAISVQVTGVAEMEVAAAITLGAEVMVQASAGNGSIDVAAGATARSIGFALAAADNALEFVPVLLQISCKGPANS
jgi:hypothetical protein